VLGGKPVAQKLLLPALNGDDLARAVTAALALLAAEDADHFDEVLGALASAERPKARLIARAMGLARHPSTVSRLSQLWTNASPRLRAILLEVMGYHDLVWAAAHLPESLRPGDPLLLGAALRLMRRLPARDPGLLWYAEDGLKNLNAGVRDEALATAYVLGSPKVWGACRAEIEEGGAGRLTFGILALSPAPEDRELLRSSVRSRWARHALWALGFAADVAAVDEIVAVMEKPKRAPMAGEALTAITGLPIEGRYRAPGVTRGPAETEVGLDDPPPVIRPEDDLPAPAPGEVGAWWKKNRDRFGPGQRYVLGVPRTPAALRSALAALPTWRREVMALEIAATEGAAVGIDVRGWTRG